MGAGQTSFTRFVVVILITICVGVLPRESAAKIFDGKRAGFMLGAYGGVAPGAKWTWDAARIDMSYTGLAGGFVIGHGVSERGAIHFDVAVVVGEIENRWFSEFSLGSFGLTVEYYLSDGPKPWFINGGLGWGVLVLEARGEDDGGRFGTAVKASVGKYIIKHIWVGGAVSHSWGSEITATSMHLLAGVMGF